MPTSTLPMASGKNTAMRKYTVAASRFSMPSKIARFQTLMPYCRPTLPTIRMSSPIDNGQASRSPLQHAHREHAEHVDDNKHDDGVGRIAMGILHPRHAEEAHGGRHPSGDGGDRKQQQHRHQHR